MKKENYKRFKVLFTEEFEWCLDTIQRFFSEQGEETLRWWHSREDEIIEQNVNVFGNKGNQQIDVCINKL